MSPETVDLEYIELEPGRASRRPSKSPTRRCAQYYEQQKDRFQTPEERHARHILVASRTTTKPLRRRRREACSRANQRRRGFRGRGAAEVSDDAGTKGAGGDLGWIGRGMLAGPVRGRAVLDAGGRGRWPGQDAIRLPHHPARRDSPGEPAPFEAVRDELASEYQSAAGRQTSSTTGERARRLSVRRVQRARERRGGDGFAAAESRGILARTGEPTAFRQQCAVVKSAFVPRCSCRAPEQRARRACATTTCGVARQCASPRPSDPLEAVRDEIAEELAPGAAEQLASKPRLANSRRRRAAEAGADMAALGRGARREWHEKRWVDRAASEVPTEVLGGRI